jgi:hypothetical protein
VKQAHRLECWIPGFQLPGDGDVKDSHHQESRSAHFGALDIGTQIIKNTSPQECRSAETRNCEMQLLNKAMVTAIGHISER